MAVPIEVERVIQVRVRGEVDTSTVDKLEQALEPYVEIACTVIVVDLNQVSFLGIAGLRILARARDRARRVGTRLQLVSTERAVERALSLLDIIDADQSSRSKI